MMKKLSVGDLIEFDAYDCHYRGIYLEGDLFYLRCVYLMGNCVTTGLFLDADNIEVCNHSVLF